MNDAISVLADSRSILLFDWPSRDVPRSLAQAGYDVVVHGGPGPQDYTAYEVVDGQLATRKVARPTQVDLVYSYRPLDELPGIVEEATSLGARAMWVQSGMAPGGAKDPTGCWLPDADAAAARRTVESAGLVYVDGLFIVDAATRR